MQRHNYLIRCSFNVSGINTLMVHTARIEFFCVIDKAIKFSGIALEINDAPRQTIRIQFENRNTFDQLQGARELLLIV